MNSNWQALKRTLEMHRTERDQEVVYIKYNERSLAANTGLGTWPNPNETTCRTPRTDARQQKELGKRFFSNGTPDREFWERSHNFFPTAFWKKAISEDKHWDWTSIWAGCRGRETRWHFSACLQATLRKKKERIEADLTSQVLFVLWFAILCFDVGNQIWWEHGGLASSDWGD